MKVDMSVKNIFLGVEDSDRPRQVPTSWVNDLPPCSVTIILLLPCCYIIATTVALFFFAVRLVGRVFSFFIFFFHIQVYEKKNNNNKELINKNHIRVDNFLTSAMKRVK